MAAPVIQPSFAAGELSPNLYSRVDLDKFHTGAATLRNMIVDYRGGVSSRAGTAFIAKAFNQNAFSKVRLVKFEFSVTQTYVLELGNNYMQVYQNGGQVQKDGGPYRLATPWTGPDLALLKFAQSNDVITIVNPNHPPYNLSRLADDNWVLERVDLDKFVPPPKLESVVSTATLSNPATNPTIYQQDSMYDYVATAVNSKGQESLASIRAYTRTYSFEQVQVTNVITLSYEGQADYFNFYRARTYVAAAANANAFPPTGQAYGFIGSSQSFSFSDSNVVPDFARTPPKHRNPFAPGQIIAIRATSQGMNYSPRTTITITDATGTGAAAIPLIDNSSKKLIGATITQAGRDYTNPTFTIVDPTGAGSGAALTADIGPKTGTYPGVVTYFQQRKLYAATINQPSTYWASRSGQFDNFDVTIPTVDSDALTFTLAALEQNPIKYMIPMQNGLVVLTGGAAWLVSGGDNKSALTPTSVNQTPQIYNGCADVQPLVIGYNILYVQQKGYVVQDVKYDFLSSVYTGEDRTYLASHLFENRTIVEWAWAEQPNRLVWAVTSDGKLLSLTYIPDQKIFGWALHETDGFVESVCVVPEAREDAVYLVVRRTGGRCVERMASRQGWTTTLNAWALDSALKYSGPPVSQVSGLDHLVGKTVSIIADGQAVGESVVQADGSVFLATPASTILVGLGFDTEFRSMYLDFPLQPTPQGRRKTFNAVTFRLVAAKGVSVGRFSNNVVPLKDDRAAADLRLVSDDIRAGFPGQWESKGQIYAKGTRGLPWTLGAIIPEVSIGDGNG